MGVVAGIVIAGGASERFGSDKLSLIDATGRTLLAAVIDGLGDVDVEQVIVVGPTREGLGEVTWTREDPPGGGPCAALVAGLRAVRSDAEVVLVLAGDAPRGARAAGALLTTVHEGASAAVLIDAKGREQPITAAYQAASLRRVLAPHADAHGLSVRMILEDMRAAGEVVVALPDEWSAAADIDVKADADRLGYRTAQQP